MYTLAVEKKTPTVFANPSIIVFSTCAKRYIIRTYKYNIRIACLYVYVWCILPRGIPYNRSLIYFP